MNPCLSSIRVNLPLQDTLFIEISPGWSRLIKGGTEQFLPLAEDFFEILIIFALGCEWPYYWPLLNTPKPNFRNLMIQFKGKMKLGQLHLSIFFAKMSASGFVAQPLPYC